MLMRFCAILSLIIVHVSSHAQKKTITIVIPKNSNERILFGTERLAKELTATGYITRLVSDDKFSSASKPIIVIANRNNGLVGKAASRFQIDTTNRAGKEGFLLSSKDDVFLISGIDASGLLYGCLELAERVQQQGLLPNNLSVTDAPEMVLRGQCIGLQKPVYLPGRHVYEYPYTPETFPWFYDKALWLRTLDSMVDNRMNSLYLWNGHPFASLVKLKDYPYAVEVDDATFKKNEEMYRFITTEADKRGIWVIQMFYNIIVSKPFAEFHKIKTQERERPIIPLIAFYYQICVSKQQ